MPDAKILYDMPEAQYHAESGIGDGLWVTRSVLLRYDQTKRGCYLRYVERHPLAQFSGNEATDFGTIVDMITTGEHDRIAIGGPINERTGKPYGHDTKAYVEWCAHCAASGLVTCSQSDYDRATLMVREAMLCPTLRYAMTCDDRKNQVVVRWHDAETGLPLQVRIDTLCPLALVDIKTGHGLPTDFFKSAEKYGYDIQSALYADAYELAAGERLPFVFAYMQSADPWAVAPIQLDQHMLRVARDRYKAAIKGIASGDWGEPTGEVYVPPTPTWWLFKYETEAGS